MEIKKSTERMLAYSLATEISQDELSQVAGGIAGKTNTLTHQSTMGGQDYTNDWVCD